MGQGAARARPPRLEREGQVLALAVDGDDRVAHLGQRHAAVAVGVQHVHRARGRLALQEEAQVLPGDVVPARALCVGLLATFMSQQPQHTMPNLGT